MSNLSPSDVFDSSGQRGLVESGGTVPNEQGQPQLVVRFEGYPPVLVPIDLLQRRKDGSYVIPLRVTELAARANDTAEETVIPVVEEEIQVGKQKIETAKVHIRKTVEERQETVDLPLLREEVEIRRVPINRPVTGPIAVRHEGDTLIVSLVEEVLVVQKQLLLKEEVHISKKQTEHHQPEQVTLRSEKVTVERVEQNAKRSR